MRPVVRGTTAKAYSHWGAARNDLGERLGWYCSYCEMAVSNMLEVEHKLPRDHGGAPLDWDNFLLSCKYCNTVKGARNSTLTGFLWPDTDNTDLAFEYSEKEVIVPNSSTTVQVQAANTISLMGLNRTPGGPNKPTDADTRWIFRLQTWLIAKQSFRNWNVAPSDEMASQIALTAKAQGFFSIWLTVFANERLVLDALYSEHPSSYRDVDVSGRRIVREGGII